MALRAKAEGGADFGAGENAAEGAVVDGLEVIR